MNTEYKAIGFDWSGVVFFHPASYPQAIKEFFGIEREEFQKIYFQYNHLLNTGNYDARDAWTKILSHFGKETQAHDFVTYLEELPQGKIHTEMMDLVVELKAKGYRVGLFSNNSLSGAKEARTFGIDTIFDVTLFSAEIGFMKPQAEAFGTLAKMLGVHLSELIFIDDSQKSLEGASDIGYTPILYKDMNQLQNELKKLLY